MKCEKSGQTGKNVKRDYEMKRMGVVIMGVAETWWKGDGEFTTQLPDSGGGGKYRVFYSGGDTRKKGVGCL